MKNFGEIDQAIKAVCPILGIAFRDLDDKSTWVINYADHATDAEKQAADALLATLELRDIDPEPSAMELRLRALESKVAQLDTSIGVLVK